MKWQVMFYSYEGIGQEINNLMEELFMQNCTSCLN